LVFQQLPVKLVGFSQGWYTQLLFQDTHTLSILAQGGATLAIPSKDAHQMAMGVFM
jgi:hypothetical protein